MRTLRVCLQTTFVTLLLTGFMYPLAMTGVAQVMFSDAANGSLLRDNTGTVRGSALLGQAFTSPAYFHGRLSAAGYDATASGGSNLGPTSARLRDRAKADVERLHRDNPDAPGAIPAELVTASASGLDPHISPATARWQLPRVARARNVAPERLRRLVEDRTEGRTFGLLGEPTVNVLLLNRALDAQFGAPAPVRAR